MTEDGKTKKYTHTFHPKEEGWGKQDELVIEIEFSPEEVEQLGIMRRQVASIKSHLPWTQSSGLARQYVVSNALDVPWAYSLKDRDRALSILTRTKQTNEEFFSDYNASTFEIHGFTEEVIDEVGVFRGNVDTFLENAESE